MTSAFLAISQYWNCLVFLPTLYMMRVSLTSSPSGCWLVIAGYWWRTFHSVNQLSYNQLASPPTHLFFFCGWVFLLPLPIRISLPVHPHHLLPLLQRSYSSPASRACRSLKCFPIISVCSISLNTSLPLFECYSEEL